MTTSASLSHPASQVVQNLCLGLPTRSPRKGSVDYYMPQAIVRALFEKWFKNKYGSNSTVMSELEYATEMLRNRPLLNKLLEAMSSDFMNAWTTKSLKGKVGNLKPGRPRKPDVIGISELSSVSGMVLELIEVTTEGEASSTIKEDLTPKLQLLNDKVIPIFRMALEDELRMSVPPVTVKASTWRPGTSELTWPFIPLNFTPRSIEWICFRPTFRVNPPNGLDGLILYEIHSMAIPQQVPEEVLNRLRQRISNVPPGMHLLPILNDHWKSNSLDADQMKAIAFVSAVGLIVLLAVIFLPAAAAATEGVAVAGIATRVAALAAAAPAAFEKAKLVLQSLNINIPAFAP